MNSARNGCLRTALAGAALTLFSGAAPVTAADDVYPSRPVRFVVPFAAGGPTDILGRLYAEKLTSHWGRQVVVDSRPGASGTLGADIVAKSNPDGYTVLFGSTSTFAVNGVVLKNIPYDIVRDFQFIGLASNGPHALMVRAGYPAKTVQDLIAMAKKQPGKIRYGSAGPGTIIQMTVELFKLHTGTDILCRGRLSRYRREHLVRRRGPGQDSAPRDRPHHRSAPGGSGSSRL
jgi:tripartite-type tricarboxylate transporter receptor subunit TctC